MSYAAKDREKTRRKTTPRFPTDINARPKVRWAQPEKKKKGTIIVPFTRHP